MNQREAKIRILFTLSAMLRLRHGEIVDAAMPLDKDTTDADVDRLERACEDLDEEFTRRIGDRYDELFQSSFPLPDGVTETAPEFQFVEEI